MSSTDKNLFLILLIACLVAYVSGIPIEGGAGDRLVQVHAVWRHGQRTPLNWWFDNASGVWPEGLGKLTKDGYLAALNLGKQRFHARYITEHDLLSADYNEDEVHVRSTSVVRTMQSAYAVMIGMYKKTAVEKENSRYPVDSLDWPEGYVPVPVFTNVNELDELNPIFKCKRKSNLQNSFRKGKQFSKFVKKNAEFLNTLSQVVNRNITVNLLFHRDESDIYFLYDQILVLKQTNRTALPEFFNDETIETLKDFVHQIERWNFGLGSTTIDGVNYQTEISRCLGGFFTRHIFSLMESRVQCDEIAEESQNRPESCRIKFYGYSSHDTGIEALFAALGYGDVTFDPEDVVPGYTSSLAFELWQKPSGEYHVKVMFFPNGGTPVDITSGVKGCQNKCKFDELVDRLSIYKPASSGICDIPVNVVV